LSFCWYANVIYCGFKKRMVYDIWFWVDKESGCKVIKWEKSTGSKRGVSPTLSEWIVGWEKSRGIHPTRKKVVLLWWWVGNGEGNRSKVVCIWSPTEVGIDSGNGYELAMSGLFCLLWYELVMCVFLLFGVIMLVELVRKVWKVGTDLISL